MSCQPTTADVEAKIVTLQAQLVKAEAAYEASITGDYESYRKAFPGGISQRIDRRKPEDIRKEIEYIEAKISQQQRKLSGCANPSVNLRRRW